MNNHFKTILTMFAVVFMVAFAFREVTKRSKTKTVNPACAQMNIIGVKEGLVVRTEDKGRVVYVSSDWDLIPMEGKEELGYWLALCRSPDERVEIRSAETGRVIREYVIDLHYKATHGIS